MAVLQSANKVWCLFTKLKIMKKKHKVIMLPTEDKTQLFTSKRNDKLHYHFKGNTPNNVKAYQHLYFISNKVINNNMSSNGDWEYNTETKELILCDGNFYNPWVKK